VAVKGGGKMLKRMKAESGVRDISCPGNIGLHLILSAMALLCVVPLLLVVSVSFTDEKTLALRGYNLIPAKFSTYAYEFIMSMGDQVIHAYQVSIIVTLVGTLLSMMIMSLYAYVISRKDFKYRNFFSFFLFFTMLFNGGLVSTYLIGVNLLRLRDNLWGLIFPYLMNAWWVMILRTYIVTNVPESLIESAKLDGAGEARIFFRIVIPLILPGLATIGLFCALQYWNDWWLAMLYIDDPKLVPLPNLLYRVQTAMQYLLQNSSNIQGGMAADILAKMPTEAARMAMAVIGVGPIVIAFPFFLKYFIRGLTVGAVKG
jgi:putative aldouronate transport system permease protein